MWPSAEALAAYLVENPEAVRGKDVLELGAGLGVPGLVAAALGAERVVLSDSRNEYLDVMRGNVEKNGLGNCTVALLDFTTCLSEIEAVFDVVLGSDIMYDVDSSATLPVALLQLLRPGGRFHNCSFDSREGREGVRGEREEGDTCRRDRRTRHIRGSDLVCIDVEFSQQDFM